MSEIGEQKSGHLTKVVWALLAVIMLAAVVRVALTGGRRPAGTVAPNLTLPVLMTVPAFELTERSGEPAGTKQLKGKVWIADFIFTNCAGPCPVMTSRMADLQKDLTDETDLRLISISVDPERDTPEVLSAYAENHKADPHRWWFFTGDRSEIYQLAIHGFKITVREPNQDAEDLGEHAILHSNYFVLVDQDARIRGYYDSADSEKMRALLDDARTLLKEGG
jgi:cytochrome oxidase Cu insertion factor (SCO1/SenC/PrrC family)